MSLTKKHVKDYCLIDDPFNKCKYLGELDGKYFCLKKSQNKAEIDEQFDRVMSKNNNQHYAVGDNCEGYYVFYNIEQGYDV